MASSPDADARGRDRRRGARLHRLRRASAAGAAAGVPGFDHRAAADHRPGARHESACRPAFRGTIRPANGCAAGWGWIATLFYDQSRIAIVPMGLCYPGRLPNGGDAPPRPECAPLWQARLLDAMPEIRLTLLVGSYALTHLLGKGSMTERVRAFRDHLPRYFPLPHPSWRTTGWERKNPWFQDEVLPTLRHTVTEVLRARQSGVIDPVICRGTVRGGMAGHDGCHSREEQVLGLVYHPRKAPRHRRAAYDVDVFACVIVATTCRQIGERDDEPEHHRQQHRRQRPARQFLHQPERIAQVRSPGDGRAGVTECLSAQRTRNGSQTTTNRHPRRRRMRPDRATTSCRAPSRAAQVM